jgi:hypothetical protein
MINGNAMPGATPSFMPPPGSGDPTDSGSDNRKPSNPDRDEMPTPDRSKRRSYRA